MLILASQSPRRKELLKLIVPDFKIIPADVDEHVHVTPEELPAAASKLKAEAIKKDHPNDDVLGCDTVVIIDGELLGKPKDEQDAFNMLRKLSGRKHVVISGYTYIKGNNRNIIFKWFNKNIICNNIFFYWVKYANKNSCFYRYI